MFSIYKKQFKEYENESNFVLLLYEGNTDKRTNKNPKKDFYIGVFQLFKQNTHLNTTALPLFDNSENKINSIHLIPSLRKNKNEFLILYSTSLCIYLQNKSDFDKIFDLSNYNLNGKIEIKFTRINLDTSSLLILFNNNNIIETKIRGIIENKNFKDFQKYLFNDKSSLKNKKPQNESNDTSYQYKNFSYSYFKDISGIAKRFIFNIGNNTQEINEVFYINQINSYLGILSYGKKFLYLINNNTFKLDLEIRSIYGEMRIILFENDLLFISTEDNNLYIIDLIKMELVHILEGHFNVIVDVICIELNDQNSNKDSSLINAVRNNTMLNNFGGKNNKQYDLNWGPSEKVYFKQITFAQDCLGAKSLRHNANAIKNYVPPKREDSSKRINNTNKIRNYKYTLYTFGKDGKCFQWEINSNKATNNKAPKNNNNIQIKLCSNKTVKPKNPIQEIIIPNTNNNPFMGCCLNNNGLMVLTQREITKTKINCNIYKVNWQS